MVKKRRKNVSISGEKEKLIEEKEKIGEKGDQSDGRDPSLDQFAFEGAFLNPALLAVEPSSTVMGRLSTDADGHLVDAYQKFSSILDCGLCQWAPTVETTLPPSAFHFFPDFSFKSLEPRGGSNDVAESALDESGRRQHLSKEQLRQLRASGRFEVPSNFPQPHVWTISGLLLVGTEEIKRGIRQCFAFAVSNLAVSIPDRLGARNASTGAAHPVSLASAFRILLGQTPASLLSILFGLSSRVSRLNFFQLLNQLRIGAALQSAAQEQTVAEHPDVVATVSFSGNKDLVDVLQRFDPAVAEDVRACCDQARTQFARERLSFQKQLRQSLVSSSSTTSAAEIEERVRRLTADELNRRELEQIEQVLAGRPEALTQVRAAFVAEQARVVCENQRALAKREFKQHLLDFPVRSLSKQWVAKQEALFSAQYDRDHNLDACRRTIELTGADLSIAQQDFEFRDPSNVKSLIKAIGTVARVPVTTFTILRRIWRPSQWKIFQSRDGKYKEMKHAVYRVSSWWPGWRVGLFLLRSFVVLSNVLFGLIPVMALSGPLSIRALVGVNRFYPAKKVCPSTGALVVDTDVKIHTLISRIGAIWRNVGASRRAFEAEPDTGLIGKSLTRQINRFYNYILKGLIGTLIVVVLGPVAILANVVICLCLAATAIFWVPASLLLRSFVCMLFYDFDFVPSSPSSSSSSFSSSFSSFWRPQQSPFFPLPRALITVVLALINIVVCVVAIVCLHPLLSLLVVVLGFLRAAIRYVYDSFTFYVIIKPRARVPLSETWIAKRISGPGKASNELMQIGIEEALIALRAALEFEQLKLLDKFVKAVLKRPEQKSLLLLSQILRPLSFDDRMAENLSQSLYNTTINGSSNLAHSDDSSSNDNEKNNKTAKDKVLKQWQLLVKERKKLLPQLPVLKGRSRMSAHALMEVKAMAQDLVFRFFQSSLFPNILKFGFQMTNVDDFIDSLLVSVVENNKNANNNNNNNDNNGSTQKNNSTNSSRRRHKLNINNNVNNEHVIADYLRIEFEVIEGDWEQLTNTMLKRALGDRFIVPLEDQDATFKVKFETLTARKFLVGIGAGLPRDPMDEESKQLQFDESKINSETFAYYHDLVVGRQIQPQNQPALASVRDLIAFLEIEDDDNDEDVDIYIRSGKQTRSLFRLPSIEEMSFPREPALIAFGGVWTKTSIAICRLIFSELKAGRDPAQNPQIIQLRQQIRANQLGLIESDENWTKYWAEKHIKIKK